MSKYTKYSSILRSVLKTKTNFSEAHRITKQVLGVGYNVAIVKNKRRYIKTNKTPLRKLINYEKNTIYLKPSNKTIAIQFRQDYTGITETAKEKFEKALTTGGRSFEGGVQVPTDIIKANIISENDEEIDILVSLNYKSQRSWHDFDAETVVNYNTKTGSYECKNAKIRGADRKDLQKCIQEWL